MPFQHGKHFVSQFPGQINTNCTCGPHCNSLMKRRLQGVLPQTRLCDFCSGIEFAFANDAMRNIVQGTRNA